METKLVVFDIAGTTVRDKGNVAESFIIAMNKHGYDVPVEEVNKVMGYRKMEAIETLLRKFYPAIENLEEVIGSVHDSFEEVMLSFYMSDTDLAPLPYAEETFRWLHASGIKVALNTGFTRPITDCILNKLGWKDSALIDAYVCSDEVPEGRPASYMINELMGRLGVSSSAEVIKVGDTEVDILEGRNAHCRRVISVTTGAYTREQLETYQPDAVIGQLSELHLYID